MRHVTISNNNRIIHLYEGQEVNGGVIKDIEVNTGNTIIEVIAKDDNNATIKK